MSMETWFQAMQLGRQHRLQNEQYARDNQLRKLTGLAYASQDPMEQRALVAKAAGTDPEAGMQLQQGLETDRGQQMATLTNMARLLTSSPVEARPGLYQRIRPGLAQLGITNTPATYEENPQLIDQTAEGILKSGMMGGAGAPAGIQEFNQLTGMANLSPEERADAARVRLGLQGRAPSAGFNWQKVQVGDQEILVRNNPMTGETEYAQVGQQGQPVGQSGAPLPRLDLRGFAPESMPQIRQQIEANEGRRFSESEWAQMTGQPQAQAQILGTNTVDLAGRTAAAQEQAKIQAQLGSAQAQAEAAGARAAAETAGRARGEREVVRLPMDALKIVQEKQDLVRGADGLNRRLSGWAEKIANGTLRLDPVLNLRWRAELASGNPSPQAVEFGNFLSDLETMRNDVLRLNAGVQTEGDAQRAMSEIISNLTSGAYVAERLNTIANRNGEAVKFHQGQVDAIYQNFGQQNPQNAQLSEDELIRKYAQ